MEVGVHPPSTLPSPLWFYSLEFRRPPICLQTVHFRLSLCRAELQGNGASRTPFTILDMNSVSRVLLVGLLLPVLSSADTFGIRADQIVPSENHKYLCHVVPTGGKLGNTDYLNPSGYTSFY